MKLYAVTVLYTSKDGRKGEATALVGADNARDAIETAVREVIAFPHCANVYGGSCHELTAPDAESAKATLFNALTTTNARPNGATVH